MIVITVDIGNTSTSMGLVSSKRVTAVQRLSTHKSTLQDIERTLRAMLVSRKEKTLPSIIASVVPRRSAVWQRALFNVTGLQPLILTHRLNLGIAIDYPRPWRIGADRLANAVGAVARYGSPVIVADFGTALTFDVIDERPAYVGGVIAPGLPLMTEYLPSRTALLPPFEIKGYRRHIGRSTLGAMQIGARIGYVGMVREIYRHICEGLPHRRRVPLVATGGYARWVVSGSKLEAKVDSSLTLFGLGKIFQLNRG